MTKEDYSYEISFFENLDKRSQSDSRVVELLAHLYTRVGRIEDGLSMDLRLSKLRPDDAMVHYNLSCSLSLVGRLEEAFDVLKQSIEMGYSDFEWMMEDSDLEAVRKLQDFKKLLDEIGHYRKSSE